MGTINGWTLHQDSITARIGDTMISAWITREGDFEQGIQNMEESASLICGESYLFAARDPELILHSCPMITVRVCEQGIPVHACQMKTNYETRQVSDIARETSPEELLLDTRRSRHHTP